MIRYFDEVIDEDAIILSDESTDQDMQKTIQQISENTQEIITLLTTEEETTEEETTEVILTSAANDIVLSDENSNSFDFISDSVVDEHLYFTGVANDVDINALYSVQLSIRNILLLFFLMFTFFKIYGAFKNLIYRLMNK